MSWGPALMIMGMFAFPFVVIWTFLTESIALYLLHFHGSFWRCLGNATLVNLVSGVVGLVWTFTYFNITAYFYWVNDLVGSPPIDTYQTLNPRTEFMGIVILLVVGWIGSILLEALVLMGLRFAQWGPLSENERADQGLIWWYALEISAIINTVSYIGLFAALIIF
jgi:hypothetical protein